MWLVILGIGRFRVNAGVGEGKDMVPETRDKMVNIRKSCLDGDSDEINFASVSDQFITTQLIRVWIERPFVDGERVGRCLDLGLAY